MSDFATVTRAAPRGMITFRGDITSSAVKTAVKAATGVAIPKAGKVAGDAGGGVLWMSPDEVLLMVRYGDVQGTITQLNRDLEKSHILVADVSDARAVFRVEGIHAAQVLARLCPVDFHPDSFGIATMRRTRLAQVAAAVWRDGTGFDVVCFRSVADYADAILRRAAMSVVPVA